MLIGESLKRHPDQPAHSIASYQSPVKEACAKWGFSQPCPSRCPMGRALQRCQSFVGRLDLPCQSGTFKRKQKGNREVLFFIQDLIPSLPSQDVTPSSPFPERTSKGTQKFVFYMLKISSWRNMILNYNFLGCCLSQWAWLIIAVIVLATSSANLSHALDEGHEHSQRCAQIKHSWAPFLNL